MPAESHEFPCIWSARTQKNAIQTFNEPCCYFYWDGNCDRICLCLETNTYSCQCFVREALLLMMILQIDVSPILCGSLNIIFNWRIKHECCDPVAWAIVAFSLWYSLKIRLWLTHQTEIKTFEATLFFHQ